MIEVVRTNRLFDLEKLVEEVSRAQRVMQFCDGPYGNCISLPSTGEIIGPFRSHHNNLPFAGALRTCSYMNEIFHSFQSEKAAFRLLRRKPHSAYALHDDRDKGSRDKGTVQRGLDIVRFQIPIVTNDRAFLLIPHADMDFGFVDAEVARAAERKEDRIWFDMEKLDRATGGRFDLFSLEPGYLYYFDTDQIHTLINAGDSQRVVLSLDLVMNPWLRSWMQSSLTHRIAPSTSPRTPQLRWDFSALRCGVIRNC